MTEQDRKPYTVLIVDDSPVNLKILGRMLQPHYKVQVATSGLKALEIANASRTPDLILLDVVMPDMDGYEVCRQLKTEDRLKNIPVIFITAKDQEEDETKGLELGAVDYITKPFSPPILKARVKTHLELKRHRDTLENLSSIDGLTGIANRRRLDEVLFAEWKKQQSSAQCLSLLMLDIDYFKQYNDHLGHIAGDDCLKSIATNLSSIVRRPPDFIARFGGEEFAIILPNTCASGSKAVAEKVIVLMEHLAIPHPYSKTAPYVTCSIGGATIIPDRSRSPVSLIETADQCLYQAKRNGRNCLMIQDLREDPLFWQRTP